jgi:hypothetical protein
MKILIGPTSKLLVCAAVRLFGHKSEKCTRNCTCSGCSSLQRRCFSSRDIYDEVPAQPSRFWPSALETPVVERGDAALSTRPGDCALAARPVHREEHHEKLKAVPKVPIQRRHSGTWRGRRYRKQYKARRIQFLERPGNALPMRHMRLCRRMG